jgi:hypothetical protein
MTENVWVLHPGDVVEILGTRYRYAYDPDSPHETHVPSGDVTPAEIEE